MIRTFAVMLGVATQRVLMLVLIPLTGIGAEIMFASCMVLGMVINIAVAEYWIGLTRTPGNGHRHWKDLDRKMASLKQYWQVEKIELRSQNYRNYSQ